MATVTLNQYLQRISHAQYMQDGDQLSWLLSFRDPHIMNPRLRVGQPEHQVSLNVYPPLDEVVSAHLKALCSLGVGDRMEVWRTQTVVVNAVAKFMQESKEENWMLPIMNMVCLDLRLAALAADAEASRKGTHKPGEILEKAAETLMACFRVCAADTRAGENDTKRWGLLYLVNQFFKIYFKINKLNLCKPMIRAIESLSFKDQYPLSQLITYKYYTGRKAMFDSDFAAADTALSFAFQHCHRRSRKNKRRILLYLLPVKMLIGYLPCMSVLGKYNLPEFRDIVISVRQGNIRLLNEAFTRHEHFFIGAGIYLILEKLKAVAFRNLFKRVYHIKGTYQIDIACFLQSLHWMQMKDIDSDEAECIIANMIYDGRVKGYISHAHRKVVVSKKDPFPPLTAC